MRFEKIMQLWITGVIFLMSASAYAAEEDILTISPAGDAPEVYEITLSGTRDYDTAKVVNRTVNDSVWYCGGSSPENAVENRIRDVGSQGGESFSQVPTAESPLIIPVGADVIHSIGCHPFFSITAVIETGENPGTSTYQMKYKVFLQPGSCYAVSYSVRDLKDTDMKPGKIVIVPPNEYSGMTAGGLFFFCPSEQLPINLNLQNATGEISGTDSFTLRNLGAELGSGEKFNAWGKFQWNPDTLSWTLKDAGVEK